MSGRFCLTDLAGAVTHSRAGHVMYVMHVMYVTLTNIMSVENIGQDTCPITFAKSRWKMSGGFCLTDQPGWRGDAG